MADVSRIRAVAIKVLGPVAIAILAAIKLGLARIAVRAVVGLVALAMGAATAPTTPSAAAQTASPVPSTVPGAAAKRAALNAANAANAQLAAETGDAPHPIQQGRGRPAAPPPTPESNAKPTPASQAASKVEPKPELKPEPELKAAAKPETKPETKAEGKSDVPVIMRESFSYDGGGRRDPFVSLMGTTDLRPAIGDLRLTGILYDLSGRRPVAIMREAGTDQQYRVTTGMTLGRMRVAQIKPKSVIFVIEEFGYSRRDSLVLVDSTRMRTP